MHCPSYDNAGNLMTDTYAGVGSRTYDAENRMTTAADNTGQVSRYTYDADDHRVRRQVGLSREEWQIYGIDGELIAEYPANGPAASPHKEYGYRNGQLLVTAEPATSNVALAANGATVTSSSTLSPYVVGNVIDGSRQATNNTVWLDNTFNSFPDWVEVSFNGSKTISEIDVITQQDDPQHPVEPTLTQTFSLYGITGFDVQYWNGSAWTTVTGGSVTGNNKVWRQFTFTPITTTKVRVVVNGGVDNAYSRVVEVEAWGHDAVSGNLHWLVSDHLGTPRMIVDQTGNLANVRRHDYLPFGEELFAATGGRTTAQGYSGGDGIRQQFTSKERDIETGLDFFEARYYASAQGRFTSPDPLQASAKRRNPQTWNRYTYGMNNPLRFTDPEGEDAVDENPDVYMRTKIKTTEIVVQERGGGQIIREAKVTVTESQTEYASEPDGDASQVLPVETSATAVNTGNGVLEFSQDQRDKMATAAQAIVEVSREKGFDATIALGIAQTETHMTTLKSQETSLAKQTDVNPMQLSGGRAKAGDLRGNIAGAIDVFNSNSAPTNSLNQRLQDYNRQAGSAAYANTAEGHINRIRGSVQTRTVISNLSQRPARFGFPTRPQ